MKKKNPFTRLSDNQEYLIECVNMFDRSKDIKHKVIKKKQNITTFLKTETRFQK